MIPEFTLIVSFCAPAAGVADDAYRQLTLSGLERLPARTHEAERECHNDAYLPMLPHERWLAKRAGLPTSLLPSTPYMCLANGGIADTRTQACLQPAHIHVARDHLVVLDPVQLRPEAVDADALHAVIASLVDEMGIMLDAMHAVCWYVADSLSGDLIVAVPQRTTGHNIDIWMHKGEQERVWRKFQNEIQMTWYDHPANQTREVCGLLSVNSVWLLGQGVLIDACPIAERMIGADPLFTGLYHVGHVTELCAETLIVVPFDDISAAALLGDTGKSYLSADWYDWIETLCAYDRDRSSPAVDTLADGRINAVSLVLAGGLHYAHYRVTRRELAIGPFGWLHRSSRPRTLRDALSPLSMAA